VLGHDLAEDAKGHRRLLSLVGHETGCYEDLTVAENVRFAARVCGVEAPPEAEVLEQFGLTPLSEVVQGRLSAGQRRRLAFAVAMVRKPRLLLLDEPHAGLDAEGRAALDAVLAGSSAAGRSVVLVSHELERARPLSSREVVLTAGQAHGALPDPEAHDTADPAPSAADRATSSGSRT